MKQYVWSCNIHHAQTNQIIKMFYNYFDSIFLYIALALTTKYYN